jgi:subtilisin family serine protease
MLNNFKNHHVKILIFLFAINIYTCLSLSEHYEFNPRLFELFCVAEAQAADKRQSHEGFATGEGWYRTEDEVSGITNKAKFEFDIKYKKEKPTGFLLYQLQGLNLDSTDIELIYVIGDVARFAGTATLNNIEGYYFYVIAKDLAEPGRNVDDFEISIWDGDPNSSETNLIHKTFSIINGGNIQVKKSFGGCTDDDHDGFAPEGNSCGFVDCNDEDPAVNPDADELCNDNIDNDCDGEVDDGCGPECTDNDEDTYAVEGGDCGPIDCDDNDPAVQPGAVETCDGSDNNCNGQVDENLGSTTCGVGQCQNTIDNCIDGVTQQCIPGSTTPETCDGIDNDCDGSVDEELGSTTCGVGQCEATVNACENGQAQECVPGSPAAEVCNGLDDDCDGQVDDGFGTLTCGTGECEKEVSECIDGQIQACVPGDSTPETCDGIDNDCDGSVDEELGAITCGVGQCEATVNACENGQAQQCVPGSPAAEVCNGLDDDCNGQVDDGFGTLTCGTGECEKEVSECIDGQIQACVPGDSTPETCDGIDNNCNGQVDENLTRATTCGVEQCESTGLETCADGEWSGDTCDVASTDGTTCDDSSACTDSDICSAGACVGGPALDCDDGLFCNGPETCDSLYGCQDGTPPCVEEQCDEDTEFCEYFTTLDGDDNDPATSAIPDLNHTLRAEDFSDDHPELGGLMVSFNTLSLAFTLDTTVGEANTILVALGAKIVGGMPGVAGQIEGVLLLRLPITTHAEMIATIEALRANPNVKIAVQEGLHETTSIPKLNEHYIQNDWSWEVSPSGGNWGLEFIRVPQMWGLNDAIKKQGTSTVTGIHDVGFAFSHPDLIINLTSSFYASHGTHVAGTIGAIFDNGIGVDGINPYAHLVGNSYQLSSATGWGLLDFISSREEIQVVNVSVGYDWVKAGMDPHTDLIAQTYVKEQATIFNLMQDIIKFSRGRLPLILSAAGNESNIVPNFDAKWGSETNYAALVLNADNILVVEALAAGGAAIRNTSNVNGHISAPGEDIMSTDLILGSAPTYGLKSGTSMAAPHVTGVASYLLSLDPTLTTSELKQLLLWEAEPVGGVAKPRIDAFDSALGIDGIRGNTDILMKLVDIDDGSLDGNKRTLCNDTCSDFLDTDVDGDGGRGDGSVDMSDFRAWRDWLLQVQDDPALHLDGDVYHPKKDLNGDGEFQIAGFENVYPRGDFNGDGEIDETNTSHVPGAINNDVTDLEVLKHLFNDPYYQSGDLQGLIKSWDLEVDTHKCFEAFGAAEIRSILFVGGSPLEERYHTSAEDIHIYTASSDENGYTLKIEAFDGDGKVIAVDQKNFVPELGGDDLYQPECGYIVAQPDSLQLYLKTGQTEDLTIDLVSYKLTADYDVINSVPNVVVNNNQGTVQADSTSPLDLTLGCPDNSSGVYNYPLDFNWVDESGNSLSENVPETIEVELTCCEENECLEIVRQSLSTSSYVGYSTSCYCSDGVTYHHAQSMSYSSIEDWSTLSRLSTTERFNSDNRTEIISWVAPLYTAGWMATTDTSAERDCPEVPACEGRVVSATAFTSLSSDTDFVFDNMTFTTRGEHTARTTRDSFHNEEWNWGQQIRGEGNITTRYKYVTNNWNSKLTITWPCTLTEVWVKNCLPSDPYCIHGNVLMHTYSDRSNADMECGTFSWDINHDRLIWVKFRTQNIAFEEGGSSTSCGLCDAEGGLYEIELKGLEYNDAP